MTQSVSSSITLSTQPQTVVVPPLTQMGLGERFAHLFSGIVYFCQDSGRWKVWNGKNFVHSPILIQRYAKAAIKSYLKDISPNSTIITQDGEPVTFDDVANFVKNNSKASSIKGLLFCARSLMGITAEECDFDTQSHLFGCLNGIVNLVKGQFSDHDPQRKISKIGGAAFDSKAQCPKWNKSLDDFTKGRKSLKEYLQVIAGYALTGETTEQVMFLFYGTGANGKSTFLDILLKVAGNYGMTTPSRTLMLTNSRLIRNDIARLMGARVVSAIEVNQGRQFDEAIVKQLTGGDKVAASFLRKEIFEFKPEFKVIIAANTFPETRGADDGIKRRIKVVPFDAKFKKKAINKDLPKELAAELPGIFNWMIQGAIKWYKNGLPNCPVVNKATEIFHKTQDQLQEFIEDCCQKGNGKKVPLRHLYDCYVDWTDQAGYDKEGKKQFGNWMRQKGFEQCKSGSVRYWKDLTCNPAAANPIASILPTNAPNVGNNPANPSNSTK